MGEKGVGATHRVPITFGVVRCLHLLEYPEIGPGKSRIHELRDDELFVKGR